MVMIRFGGQQANTATFTFGGRFDADRALPSIETDSSSADDRADTPSTTNYNPSTSTDTRSQRCDSTRVDADPQLSGLKDLRLGSSEPPSTSSSQADSCTPSIDITPAASPDIVMPNVNERSNDLTARLSALGLRGSTRTPPRSRRENVESPSPRRRRSGSAVNKELYRVEDEALLTSAYSPKMQRAFGNAKTEAASLAKALSSSTLHLESGSTIEKLHRQALELSEFKLPVSRIVGLVGDSGVGKSSLINALLDAADLARASSSGSACTCAVTEYKYHESNDFVVEIDYFTPDELQTQFEELLGAYRAYEFEKSKTSSNRDHLDRSSDDELQKTAKLAQETFRAVFGNMLEDHPAVLASMLLETAAGTMVTWATNIIPQRKGPEIFTTASQCADRLKTLTSDTPDGVARTTPWPLIRKLRVYLNAYILSQGLVIADLPGLRDLNSARRAITERYVRKCHRVLVVARIDRAITDQSIKDIFELSSAARLSNVDIVCTRSEDIQAREARHDWPRKKSEIDQRVKLIDDDVEEIQCLEDEIQDYDQDDGDLTREQERALSDLQRDLRRIQLAKTAHEFELQSYIMDLRNNKVTGGLRDAYKKYAIAANLEVFCVSNVMYWDNRSKVRHIATPPIKRSGIPTLRQHCIGIVADSRYRAAKDFVQNELPAFLGSVDLWIQAGSGNMSAETKQNILNCLSDMKTELNDLTMPDSPANMLSIRLSRQFETLSQRMESRGPHWSSAASRTSESWSGWHHSSYRAWCSNYGDHWTKTMQSRCWNAEVMQSVDADMSALWTSFPAELMTQLESVKTFVETTCGNLRTTALSGFTSRRGSGDDSSRAMRTLAATVQHQLLSLLFDLDNLFENFFNGLDALRTDSLSSIRTAFLGQLIEDSYHEANMEHGTGSDRRRKDIMTAGFGSRSLFPAHRRRCKNDFRDLCHALQLQIDEELEGYAQGILANVHILEEENAVLENERSPELKERVKAQLEDVKIELAKMYKIFD